MFFSVVTVPRNVARADRNVPSAESLAWTFASSAFRRNVFGPPSACTSFCTRPATSRPEPTPELMMLPMTHPFNRMQASTELDWPRARCMPASTVGIEQRPHALEMAHDGQDLGRRDLPYDLVRRRVEHGDHCAPAELIDLEAQAALRFAHDLVQALHCALEVGARHRRLRGRQVPAGDGQGFAGRQATWARGHCGLLNRGRRRPCWCRGNCVRVTHTCHLGSVASGLRSAGDAWGRHVSDVPPHFTSLVAK